MSRTAGAREPEQAQRLAEFGETLPVTGFDGVDLEGGLYRSIAEPLMEGSYSALPRTYWSNAAVYEELSNGGQGLITGQRTVDDVLAAMDVAWSKASAEEPTLRKDRASKCNTSQNII